MNLESILATTGLYAFTLSAGYLVIKDMIEKDKKERERIAPYEHAIRLVIREYDEDILDPYKEFKDSVNDHTYLRIENGELVFFNSLAVSHGRIVMCEDEEGLLSDGSEKKYLLMVRKEDGEFIESLVFEIPTDHETIIHRDDLSVEPQECELYSTCEYYNFLLEDRIGNTLEVRHRVKITQVPPGGFF